MKAVLDTKTGVVSLQASIPEGRALVLFGSENCVPCDRLKPLLVNEVARRPGLGYLAMTVNDETKALYKRYAVRSAPTVVFFYNGNEVGRFSGFRPADALNETLNRWNA